MFPLPQNNSRSLYLWFNLRRKPIFVFGLLRNSIYWSITYSHLAENLLIWFITNAIDVKIPIITPAPKLRLDRYDSKLLYPPYYPITRPCSFIWASRSTGSSVAIGTRKSKPHIAEILDWYTPAALIWVYCKTYWACKHSMHTSNLLEQSQ